jgi:predicted RNase H-like HicB family nuclease
MKPIQGAYVVSASWDKEAKVWVAESDDVPGLATEAASPEALLTKLKTLIPELLELNGRLPSKREALEILIRYYREERVSVAA